MSKKNKIVIITTVIIAIILLFLWLTGFIGLWRDGISYIANNTKQFTDTEGHVLQGEYSISIDLADLKSNIGKELYKDKNNKIYVSWIDIENGYRIGFRSCGTYSLTNATLISGIHHETVDENSFKYSMSAKMVAEYNGKTYNSKECGTSGLNYKDGDGFAFYIFPGVAYDKQEITSNEEGIVHLTVTNLYKNIWNRK